MEWLSEGDIAGDQQFWLSCSARCATPRTITRRTLVGASTFYMCGRVSDFPFSHRKGRIASIAVWTPMKRLHSILFILDLVLGKYGPPLSSWTLRMLDHTHTRAPNFLYEPLNSADPSRSRPKLMSIVHFLPHLREQTEDDHDDDNDEAVDDVHNDDGEDGEQGNSEPPPDFFEGLEEFLVTPPPYTQTQGESSSGSSTSTRACRPCKDKDEDEDADSQLLQQGSCRRVPRRCGTGSHYYGHH
ncbi:uncharacterized protein G2W53_010528 [Senna tora]|uniref:Uncharacterized protein n=1 Tax=Senna tora TaxID=362788 RepID=A0A834X0F6_9FABA|nr:uncharacterized protein G2W53_010528 [Senna tora]